MLPDVPKGVLTVTMRCFLAVVFAVLGLLAGCTESRPSDFASTSTVYAGRVVAVREVTGGALTAQITQILGQPDYASLASGKEVVVRLADGEIKTFVPPQGSLSARLAPGDDVVISTTPNLKISLR